MTPHLLNHPRRSGRYQSLQNFYRADARRQRSREHDFGLWWRVGAHGPLHRVAWVQSTGELYVTPLGALRDGAGELTVLGVSKDLQQLEQVLDGWKEVCPVPDSMTWLRHRAARLAPPEPAAPAFAGASSGRGVRAARRHPAAGSRRGGLAPRAARPGAGVTARAA